MVLQYLLGKLWAPAVEKTTCPPEVQQLYNNFVDTLVDTMHAKGPVLYNPTSLNQGHAPHAQPPHPPVYRVPPAERLVAIGDLHGDLDKARLAFQLAGLTDKAGHWTGGKTVVVQVGDQLDRGDNEVALLFFLERLRKEAQAAGGQLFVMNGNHETMNVHGRFRYATQGGFEDFRSWRLAQQLGTAMKATCGVAPGRCDPGHLPSKPPKDVPFLSGHGVRPPPPTLAGGVAARGAAVNPGGPMTKRFFASHPVVLQVGSTLFCHGGVLPRHVDYGLDRINKETYDWMVGRSVNKPDFLLGRDAVVWSRHFSDEKKEHCDCETLVETLRKAPGAERMVVGHTIQQGGINTACSNRVVRVDVGMSKGCGDRQVEVLEILKDGQTVRRLRLGHAPEQIVGAPPSFFKSFGLGTAGPGERADSPREKRRMAA